jgi:hypothetical protein
VVRHPTGPVACLVTREDPRVGCAARTSSGWRILVHCHGLSGVERARGLRLSLFWFSALSAGFGWRAVREAGLDERCPVIFVFV